MFFLRRYSLDRFRGSVFKSSFESEPGSQGVKLAMKPLDYVRVSPNTMWIMTAPFRAYFSPVFEGLSNIPDQGPFLFVGNHTIYGVFDIPLIVAGLYREKGIYLRVLGDKLHFMVPVWGDFLKALGVVEGTPGNCAALMEAGENILVYPGGGREVCKRRGERYKLIWKERAGFVRMAVRHGYRILPMASVGPEEAWSILYDADDFLKTWVGKILTRKGMVREILRNGEAIPPLARGIGPTMIPRPERFYFSFGKPVETECLAGAVHDRAVLHGIRKEVGDSITDQIGKLLIRREQDMNMGLLRRILNHL